MASSFPHSTTSTKKNMKIRIPKLVASILALGAIMGGAAQVNAQVLLKVDPSQPWVGYMNVYSLAGAGVGVAAEGAYQSSSGVWATTDLRASFGTTNLTLSPCTNVWETTDDYWVQADGRTPNEIMDANFYVEDSSALLNTNVVFVGSCRSNSLCNNPEPLTGVTYTSMAFIKLFDSGYNLLGEASTNLVPGQAFSLSQNTTGAVHVQYGFETIGPDAAPTNNTLGNVIVAAAGQSATVTVDPSQTWIGYMNVFDLPVSAGGDGNYDFGSAWAPTDLQAYLSPTNLTLEPCTNIWETTNSYYVQANGTTPNKTMDASMYVQNDGLVNTNLIFIGTCLNNNLTTQPEPLTGITYTSVAFIKIFDGSFNLLGSATSTGLTAGQPFAISLNTVGATHVQYGFETVGPDASPANSLSLGSVVLSASIPPNPAPTLTNNAPTPTHPQSKVLSLYNSSGVYTNHPVEDFLATWSGATLSSFTIPGTGGRTVLKYSNLQYAGVEFYNNVGINGPNIGGATNYAINTTGYDTFHVDLWTPNGNMFGIQLVSIDPTTQAAQVDFLPNNGVNSISNYTWISLDIPLSTFAAKNPSTIFTNLEQLLWIDNQTTNGVAAGITGATYYIDNVYFYNSTYVAPAQPRITASSAGGNVQLSFATQTGYTYTVLYKNHITDAVWTTLSSVSGNNSTQIVPDVKSQSSRFYRVSVQ
jgi:hypothetical protein